MSGGTRIVREWLDGLDQELAARSDRARASRHPTMTGNYREDALRDSLRQFLPRALHVGTGRVFSVDGTMSKQTDVVIHDGRYPVLQQGEASLFPIESVLATIEVKSSLDAASLQDAWAKCISVAGLRTCIADEDVETLRSKLVGKGIGSTECTEIVDSYIRPVTYIFSFDGFTTPAALSEAIMTLPGTVGVAVSSTTDQPVVPSVVVSGGGAVGLAWGDPVCVWPAADQPQLPAGQRPFFVSVQSDHGFGMLAAHLMWTIEKRTTLGEMRFGVRRSMMNYLPFDEYLEGPVAGHFAISLMPAKESNA